MNLRYLKMFTHATEVTLKISSRWCIASRFPRLFFNISFYERGRKNTHTESLDFRIPKRFALVADYVSSHYISRKLRETTRRSNIRSGYHSFTANNVEEREKSESYKEMSNQCAPRKSPFRDALSLTGCDKPFSAEMRFPRVVKCTRTEWENTWTRERTSNSRWTWSSLPISLSFSISLSLVEITSSRAKFENEFSMSRVKERDDLCSHSEGVSA